MDCSTAAAKAIVVDPTGRVLASGSHPLATRSPAPHRFEQHAADWWAATDSAIRRALVVAGTGDGQAAGIGLGVTDPGAVYLVLGTAVVIGSETTSYLPSRAYRSMISAMPNQTTVETFSSSGTFLSTWFRQEFGDPELAGAPDPALERAAAAVAVGSERLLTLPH